MRSMSRPMVRPSASASALQPSLCEVESDSDWKVRQERLAFGVMVDGEIGLARGSENLRDACDGY